MKTTFKLMAVASVASMLFGSQAFAGNSLAQQRLAERNAAYFKQTGMQTSSNWKPSTAPYEASSPHQRMAQRNAEYFAGKTAGATESQPIIKPTNSHPTKH